MVNRIQKSVYSGYTIPGAAPHHRTWYAVVVWRNSERYWRWYVLLTPDEQIADRMLAAAQYLQETCAGSTGF